MITQRFADADINYRAKIMIGAGSLSLHMAIALLKRFSRQLLDNKVSIIPNCALNDKASYFKLTF